MSGSRPEASTNKSDMVTQIKRLIKERQESGTIEATIPIQRKIDKLFTKITGLSL